MKETDEIVGALGKLREEEDALDQSVALNKIVLQLLKTKAQENKRLWVALVISILMNLCIVGGFLWYESQWVYTTTSTTEVTQDSEDTGSNLLQFGDNSRMFFSIGEDDIDGQAIGENNNNPDSQS